MSVRKQTTGIQEITTPSTKLGRIESGRIGQVAMPEVQQVSKGENIAKLVGGFIGAAADFKNFEAREEAKTKREQEINQAKVTKQNKIDNSINMDLHMVDLKERELNQSSEENKVMWAGFNSQLEDNLVTDKNELNEYMFNKYHKSGSQKYLDYSAKFNDEVQAKNMESLSNDFSEGILLTGNKKEMINSLTNSISDSTNEWKESGILDNRNISTTIQAGLKKNAQIISSNGQISMADKVQQLETIQEVYNTNQFLGKNKSFGGKQNTVDFTETINSLKAGIVKQEKDLFNNVDANINYTYDLDEEDYQTFLSSGVNQGTIKQADAIKKYEKYTNGREKYIQAEIFNNVVGTKLDNNESIEDIYIKGSTQDKEKIDTYTDSIFNDSIELINSGNPTMVNKGVSKLNDFIIKNPTIGGKVIQDKFNQVRTLEDANKGMIFYNSIKNTDNGLYVINGLDDKTKELYTMLEITQPTTDEDFIAIKNSVDNGTKYSTKTLKENGIEVEGHLEELGDTFEKFNIPYQDRQTYTDKFNRLSMVTGNPEEALKLINNELNTSIEKIVVEKDWAFDDNINGVKLQQSSLMKEGYTTKDIVNTIHNSGRDLDENDTVKYDNVTKSFKIYSEGESITKQGILETDLKVLLDNSEDTDKAKKIKKQNDLEKEYKSEEYINETKKRRESIKSFRKKQLEKYKEAKMKPKEQSLYDNVKSFFGNIIGE